MPAVRSRGTSPGRRVTRTPCPLRFSNQTRVWPSLSNCTSSSRGRRLSAAGETDEGQRPKGIFFLSGISTSNVRSELGDQFLLGHVAGYSFLDCTAFEKHQGGNAHDAELHDDIRIFVRVALDHLYLAIPFRGQLPDDRVDHL